MPDSFSIIASCAALSDAVVKNILEAGNLARKVRESRHDMNAVNAELLAIKTTVEIIYDDFKSGKANLPAPLLKTLSGILDCCGEAIEESHAATMKHPGSDRDSIWSGASVSTRIHQHLQLLRTILDLALDQMTLFIALACRNKVLFASAQEQARSAPDTKQVLQLLKRIDAERERIRDRTDYSTLLLDRKLNELRLCAEDMYEESVADEEEPKRSDSMDPEEQEVVLREVRDGQNRSMLTLSSEGSGSGIGIWLENVASHTVQKPTERPEVVMIPKPRTRAANQRTQSVVMTFYAESTTSGSLSYSKSIQSRGRSRTRRPPPLPKTPRAKKKMSYATTTTTMTNSSDASVLRILDQYINPDKVAIAKSKRMSLHTDARAAVDWALRTSHRNATLMDFEKPLWEGADPNMEDPDFGYFFIRAAHTLPTDFVCLLVEYGADITRRGAEPYTSALHAAAAGNQFETVQYLIDLGAEIDEENANGETPLHLAVRTPGAYPIARYLLEYGADITGISLQTVVTATKVESRERSLMAELLLAHGAEEDLNGEDCARRGKGLSVLGLI